jgi:hypothetical protein
MSALSTWSLISNQQFYLNYQVIGIPQRSGKYSLEKC